MTHPTLIQARTLMLEAETDRFQVELRFKEQQVIAFLYYEARPFGEILVDLDRFPKVSCSIAGPTEGLELANELVAKLEALTENPLLKRAREIMSAAAVDPSHNYNVKFPPTYRENAITVSFWAGETEIGSVTFTVEEDGKAYVGSATPRTHVPIISELIRNLTALTLTQANIKRVFVAERDGKPIVYNGLHTEAVATVSLAKARIEVTPLPRLNSERMVPYVSVEDLQRLLPYSHELDALIRAAKAGLYDE